MVPGGGPHIWRFVDEEEFFYMENNMNNQAVAAKTSEIMRETFIKDMERTILRFASGITGRFITKSDDEWSIALFAFNKAIDSYSEDKGDYMAYSKLLIDRALIDYRRSESRHSAEILYDPEILEGEDSGPIYEKLLRESSVHEEKQLVNTDLKDEIEDINENLRKYGFSFFDVAGSSPKSVKMRSECGKVMFEIVNDREMKASVLKTGKLPLKQLCSKLAISRFMLDRHRKYILTGVIILSGEYPLIESYLQYTRNEIRKELRSDEGCCA